MCIYSIHKCVCCISTFPHLKPDSILQYHKPLCWHQIALCSTAVGISDGKLNSYGAKCAFLRIPNHVQGGHTLTQA